MFDKVRCIENIYAMAKEKGLKIGDLEVEANVSKGYLSRVLKPDYSGSPSIELLDTIAGKLGVSIDFLVNHLYGDINGDDRFLYEFFEKLRKKTSDNTISWKCQSKKELTTEDIPDSCFFMDTPVKYIRQKPYQYISSFNNEEVSISVNGAFYQARLPSDNYLSVTIHMNSIVYSSLPNDNTQKNIPSIEVYLAKGEMIPLCSSALVAEELRNAIEQLYNSLAFCYSKTELDDNTREYLKYFLDKI